MNIVYLIGNGFDLNLDMKTKFEHFNDYFLFNPRDGDSPHIKKLKDEIEDDKENWSDLEHALGNYLSKLDENEAITLHRHLIIHLSKYIAYEEDRCIFGEGQKSRFWEYLKYPYSNNRLLFAEQNEIDDYSMNFRSHSVDIKIITFNYTRLIEKLSEYVNNTLQIGTQKHNNTLYSINLSEIEHVHGIADERMILGVNDVSQIANKKLQDKAAVIDRYVKPACNSTYGLMHDEKCQQWIQKANLLCLFGLSFGDTDKKWWELVGQALTKGCRTILFEHNLEKTFDGNQGPDIKEGKEAVKDRFLSKTNLDEGLRSKIKKIMYVAYNTDMFKLDVSFK